MHLLALVASSFLLFSPIHSTVPTSGPQPAAPLVRAAGRSTPQLYLSASTATTVGLQIFASAYLSGGSSPSGSVTFWLFGPGDTSCASVVFTSTMAVAGASMDSARYTTSAAGVYRWSAAYSGDANNDPVAPTSCANPDASVSVQGAGTYLSVTGPAPSGGSIHGAAILSGGVNPTGTITFDLAGPGDSFCSQTLFTSTVAVDGNGTYASAGYNPTATGRYRWRASYTGDANNLGDAMTGCLDQNDSVDVVSVSHPPAAAFNPTSVAFGAQQTGTTSAPRTETVTNTGGSNLTISAIGRSGPAAGDYATSNDRCTGATIAPAATCTIAVAFTPTTTGTRSANLTIDDNAAGSPHSVALNGTATAPTADRALFSYPLDGQGSVDTTRAFTWTPVPQGEAYDLVIGTSQYGTDLVSSGILPASQSGYRVPALPTGQTLYATLLTKTNGSWTLYQAITFTAAPGLATFTNPMNSQIYVGTSPVFSWSTIPQGQAYYLVVGTAKFGNDVVNSGVLPPTQSSYAGASLPSNRMLYATLLTKTNGSWTRFQSITFAT